MSEQKKLSWKKSGVYAKYGDVLGSTVISKNSTVTGHFDEDKTYHDFLRAEHVELCKQYGLKYDESKVQEESEAGDAENQQEEETGDAEETEKEEENAEAADAEPEPTPAPVPVKQKKYEAAVPSSSTITASSSDLASTLEKYFKSTSSSLLSLLSPIFEEQARRLAELEEAKTALEAKNAKLETSLKKAQNALKALME